MNEELDFCLQDIESEDGFHRLLEWPAPLLQLLLARFATEADAMRRQMFVHLAWQRREAGTSRLLRLALADGESAVWKEALDGFVSLKEPGTEQMLQEALSGCERQKDDWIREAITQLADDSA